MKTLILCFALFCSLTIFGQTTIPEKSPKGIITTITDLKIPYRDLVHNGDKVNFVNAETNVAEFLYVNSIKTINTQETSSFKDDVQKADSKKYETNVDYIRGKKLNSVGNGFLIGGGTIALVGVILNIPTEDGVSSTSTGGAKVPVLIGLGAMGVGAILKISGHSQMKEAKKTAMLEAYTKKEYFVVANQNGLGLQVKF